MLTGYSSTLLSPRHRLRSEASAQFQACNFPSMSTHRFDLPCNFPPKDASRSQPIRSIGLSVEKSIEAKTTSCSLKQNIRFPPSAATTHRERKDEFWDKSKSLKKRLAEQSSFDDEACVKRAKRKRCNRKYDDCFEEGENLSLSQLGNGSFWLQSGLNVPYSVPSVAGVNQPHVPFSLACSGDEEKVYFVTDITTLGDKNVETSQDPVKEASESSVSLERHGLVERLNENPLDVEIGNWSRLPSPGETMEVVTCHDERNHLGENNGLELVNFLVACVGAIISKNIPSISHFIRRLGELSSPRGSTVHRVTAYFTEALATRAGRVWPHIFHITPSREFYRVDDDNGTAMRFLNEVSPIPNFIYFTANEILLRAFEGKARVHIIDFDIKQGLQWPSFFQSLASRTNPPSHVRITGIGESKQELIETGDRLAGLAEALNLPFEFHPVVDRLKDVRLWMLHLKEKEGVAVNCIFQMHKILYDSSGGVLNDFLGLVRSTNATLVLVAEQEAEHNGPSLDIRFANALKYYSAIFDSIDSSLPLDSPVRIKIEEMFAHEIRNIIACEGRDRFERHESFARWQKLMEQGGFRCMGISERELLQSQMLLKMYAFQNYRVQRQGQDGAAALTLSWSDQHLYTVSAWAPVDVAGSLSSHSKPS